MVFFHIVIISGSSGHYYGFCFQGNEELSIEQEITLLMSTNIETERNKVIKRPLSSLGLKRILKYRVIHYNAGIND